MRTKIENKEKAKEAIIAIGEELIKRADDITSDLEHVTDITIYANLSYGEVAGFDITKKYVAFKKENYDE